MVVEEEEHHPLQLPRHLVMVVVVGMVGMEGERLVVMVADLVVVDMARRIDFRTKN